MQGSELIIPLWMWYIFIFAFGSCIGSFLNVVIYRLPQDKSLVSPPSACPGCGAKIGLLDNIPIVSWLLLGGKCRNCRAPISARYIIIELLTALIFTGVFYVCFHSTLRSRMPAFTQGGWFIYLLYVIMLGAFIAASAIDLELWVIPISICWFVTAAGLIGSALGVFAISPELIRGYKLLPSASADTGSLAAGAAAGLIISLILLKTGAIKRSYDWEYEFDSEEEKAAQESKCNHRAEIGREILFLLPIVACSLAWHRIADWGAIRSWWVHFSQMPAVAGFLGGLWGYFVGCGVVWATRIVGTLAFGREAMGLGDVHLMGAAGTIIGPLFATAAFFIAPFFGLAWAGIQMFFKKTRQIPYGPFLSIGVLVVIILQERILSYLNFMFYH